MAFRPKANWYLEGIMANGKTWIIPLESFPFTVGRNQECNLFLASDDISRRHAEFILDKSKVNIKDLNSTNGTYVNQNRIKSKKELVSGDSVYFGDLKFKIYAKNDIEEEKASKTVFLQTARKSVDFTKYYDLTKREEDILYYLLEGKSTKEIADILFISGGTAKNHVLNIFKKTNVHSRFELLALYNSFSANK
ncbi:MAG: FHA domain-containing protein [Spirochaetes bacterium]|nr:FHA domain-containing protein [Spirochaetota bacterium]